MINLNGILDKTKTIYINGIKASKKDLEALCEWIKARKTQIVVKTTKKGNLSIKTLN